MRFVTVRNAAFEQLERFRSTGTVAPSRREALIPAASAAETRRLQDELSHAPRQAGVAELHRRPSDREWLERSVDAKVTCRNGELARHELDTLKGEDEPYQESYEFTRFRRDGIEHVSITIMGDGGVGVGASPPWPSS